MPTPHIGAADNDFACTVLFPGDPRRARHVAETFFESPRLVTDVRGIEGFTGTYKGVPLSVMASGMGVPSAAIYATELIRFYGVKRLIRIGTAGAYDPDLALRNIVIGREAMTNSALPAAIGAKAPYLASDALVKAAEQAAAASSKSTLTATVFTSDVFYEPTDDDRIERLKQGCVCVEMEAAGIYSVAATEGAQALAIMTITDHLVTHENLSAQERQTTVDEMLELGCDTAITAIANDQ